MNKSTATLTSISATLGISISTVSRVLNDRAKKYRISDATVAKIKKEADRVGFALNQIASALRSQKTKTIALVIPVFQMVILRLLQKLLVLKQQKQAIRYYYSIL